MKFRKLFVVLAAILIAASVFLFPSFEHTFAGWTWGLFVAAMFVRPLFELVQRIPLLFPPLWTKIQQGDQWLFRLLSRIKCLPKFFAYLKIQGLWDAVKKILLLGMQWRRELGILAAVFALAHGAGALLDRHKALSDVFDPQLWNLSTYWGWGLLAATLMLPLLLTSNMISMKLLKRHWKTLQRLSYVAFIAAGIHVSLAERGEAGPLVIVGIWIVLWLIVWGLKRR